MGCARGKCHCARNAGIKSRVVLIKHEELISSHSELFHFMTDMDYDSSGGGR
ncbi:MAG: hypothetical protein K0R76_196 [Alphaproteobacteria bacterium]|jgi:hypothetical protein|nr:hypothetical protein [Alphaproteobacteria bacterium]MDF3033242.1 hypothetical protein [Alphaproteobacteria bacterium]